MADENTEEKGLKFTVSPSDVTIRPAKATNNNNLKQAQIIEKALREGKRHFGVSAASLSWMNGPDMKKNLPEDWDPKVLTTALDAERDTTAKILKWMKDKPGVVLLDSLHIPGHGEEKIDEETGLLEGGDTDHILVIGSHIIIIDTKCWKKKARYSVKDDHTVIRNGKEFPGGHVRINAAIHMWFDYVDSDEAEMTGAIMIENGDEKDKKTGEWSTSVFRGGSWWANLWFLLEPARTMQWLDERYAEWAGWDDSSNEAEDIDAVSFIDPSLITQLAVTCVRPFDRRAGLINAAALRGGGR